MLNEVTLIGNAGRDAESVGDYQFINLSLATSESYKDNLGEWKSSTEWHNIKFSGYTYEKAKNIKKGDKLFIKGKIRTYEKGSDRVLQIVANKLINFSQKEREQTI